MIEIEEIVKKIKNGEESKEVLYRRIKPFLDFQEKKYMGYANKWEIERDEIKSIVWLGVEKAIETFRGEKNYKFTTWASNCIKYVFLEENKKTEARHISFDITVGDDELSMEELIEDSSAYLEFENIETKIDGKKALAALNKLTEEERKIIVRTYIKNIPPTKVAEGMGISTGRARTLRLSALKKLKNAVLR
ncbi:MAG: sigma-70 family RNA polymerase sigma factor [Ruminococcaceae bacterium]|nr:sigma-70 family RNA polymerase sigma factor [Oscillospiraceae bacterium]